MSVIILIITLVLVLYLGVSTVLVVTHSALNSKGYLALKEHIRKLNKPHILPEVEALSFLTRIIELDKIHNISPIEPLPPLPVDNTEPQPKPNILKNFFDLSSSEPYETTRSLVEINLHKGGTGGMSRIRIGAFKSSGAGRTVPTPYEGKKSLRLLCAIKISEEWHKKYEGNINYLTTEVEPLYDWLLTNEGMKISAMTLAKYHGTLLRVRDTLEESLELLYTLSDPLKKETRELMHSFYSVIQSKKEEAEHLKELERQSIEHSLITGLKGENVFVKGYVEPQKLNSTLHDLLKIGGETDDRHNNSSND